MTNEQKELVKRNSGFSHKITASDNGKVALIFGAMNDLNSRVKEEGKNFVKSDKPSEKYGVEKLKKRNYEMEI